MSNPGEGIASTAKPVTRNPRRRQRKDVEDAGPVRQQPQRKRSKISRDTYKATGDQVESEANGHVPTDANGQVDGETDNLARVKIPLRERSQAGAVKRAPKYDGSKVLVSACAYLIAAFKLTRTPCQTRNANYSVVQLPGLPEQIRHDKRGDLAPINDGISNLTPT